MGKKFIVETDREDLSAEVLAIVLKMTIEGENTVTEYSSTLQRIKEEVASKVYVCGNGCSDEDSILCKITVGLNAVPPSRCPYFDHTQGFKLESEIEVNYEHSNV